MEWLGMTVVMAAAAACIALAFSAARWTESQHMPDRHALPETLSVLLDPEGRILEVHGMGRPLQLPGDPGPWTWQDLEPTYDIVAERQISDDEYGQVKLLQLRLKGLVMPRSAKPNGQARTAAVLPEPCLPERSQGDPQLACGRSSICSFGWSNVTRNCEKKPR